MTEKQYIITDEELSRLSQKGSCSPSCIGGFREDIAKNIRSRLGCTQPCEECAYLADAIVKRQEARSADDVLEKELVSLDMFIARHVGGEYIEIGVVRQFIHNRLAELRKGGKV